MGIRINTNVSSLNARRHLHNSTAAFGKSMKKLSSAMSEIDAAIETVLDARGEFGSLQNRLETSIRNIEMTTENFSAANSRIRDVDVAEETALLTSYQIFQQAGVSMLAIANMAPTVGTNILGR